MERRSTERLDVRRALTLQRIAKSWDKRPHESLCELLAHAAMHADVRPLSGAFETVSDEQLCVALERYVLLCADSDPPPAA